MTKSSTSKSVTHIKSKLTKNADKAHLNGSQRLREFFFIVCACFAVLISIALYSFEASDPTWLQTGWSHEVQNAGGAFGAWVASLLLFCFGVFSYAIPVLLVFLGWRILRPSPSSNVSFDFLVWGTRFLGAVLLVVSSCALAGIHFDDIWSFPSGGVIGDLVDRMLVPMLSSFGATLIFLFTWLASIPLVSGLSWLAIVEKLGLTSIKSVEKTAHTLRGDRSQSFNPDLSANHDFRDHFQDEDLQLSPDEHPQFDVSDLEVPNVAISTQQLDALEEEEANAIRATDAPKAVKKAGAKKARFSLQAPKKAKAAAQAPAAEQALASKPVAKKISLAGPAAAAAAQTIAAKAQASEDDEFEGPKLGDLSQLDIDDDAMQMPSTPPAPRAQPSQSAAPVSAEPQEQAQAAVVSEALAPQSTAPESKVAAQTVEEVTPVTEPAPAPQVQVAEVEAVAAKAEAIQAESEPEEKPEAPRRLSMAEKIMAIEKREAQRLAEQEKAAAQAAAQGPTPEEIAAEQARQAQAARQLEALRQQQEAERLEAERQAQQQALFAQAQQQQQQEEARQQEAMRQAQETERLAAERQAAERQAEIARQEAERREQEEAQQLEEARQLEAMQQAQAAESQAYSMQNKLQSVAANNIHQLYSASNAPDYQDDVYEDESLDTASFDENNFEQTLSKHDVAQTSTPSFEQPKAHTPTPAYVEPTPEPQHVPTQAVTPTQAPVQASSQAQMDNQAEAKALYDMVQQAQAKEKLMQNPFLMDEPNLPEPTTPMPTLDLLEQPQKGEKYIDHEALEDMARLVEEKLADFKIEAQVVDIFPGPVITRFELDLAPGVKASRITGLSTDLARSLSVSSVRVVEVLPGKPYIGLELPNIIRETVYFSEVVGSEVFQEQKSATAVVLGQDIAGEPVVADLAKMPHVLVAGTTGSGKSVGVNVMILSMLYKAKPEDVRFIMIDPKMLELSIYEGIPHLLSEVVTDMKDAANALRWCVGEMERRYKLLSKLKVRNIKGFNEKIEMAREAGYPIPDPLWQPGDTMDETAPLLEKLPSIVVIVDEFADLIMVVGKKVEELIARLAQKARAAGIHLVLATQRPSVDVITGLIKANIPSRVAFTVSTKTDSRTILDQGGAESLLGMGDMLYQPSGTNHPMRVHGAFASDDDVNAVVNDWKARGRPQYIESITSGEKTADNLLPGESLDTGEASKDELYDQVVEFCAETRKGSISAVQRHFSIGYNRSAKIIDQLQAEGILSEPSKNGMREVLIPPPIKQFD